MSQHFQSNTDLSNNSNFDDAIGSMNDLCHQESNATDESSASQLMMNNITLMGLNHLQSSPLQQWVNPNLNAPKLVIPPSKIDIPPDSITPGNNKIKNDNNKPPELQIQMEQENDESKNINDNDSNNIPHPITPATDLSFNYQTGISPVPPQQRGFAQNEMAQLENINQFIPQFWQCFQDLATNVNSMQRQLSKLQQSNSNKSSRSSTKTRYRSQSNSSTNSLRTQTSIASSTYNNSAHGVIYSNSTNDSLYNTRRISNIIAPGANINEKEKAKKKKNKIKKTHFLGTQTHSKQYNYNKFSQYRRRKSIGPGGANKSKTGSISPYASSPKTADSLELLDISQRQNNSNKSKIKPDRRQRNRSKSFVGSKDKKRIDFNKKRRTTIAVANENKMSNEENNNNNFSDDDTFFDDAISLYSDKVYSNTMTSALSVLESQPIQQRLSIIQPNKKDNNHILYEDFEGNGNGKLSNKFHRKKINKSPAQSRKPSSSAASNSSGHVSNQSQLSISSIAITNVTNQSDNENDIILSRSVPHSPDSNHIKFNKSHFNNGNENAKHLYPTPTVAPTLTQSHSAHNITVTATITPTPMQRPNTPTNTPLSTPNASCNTLMNNDIISPPLNGYDISYSNANNMNENNKNNKRKSSLTPPQEDKEQDDYFLQQLQLDNISNISNGCDEQHFHIVDDREIFINGDKVDPLPVYGGGNTSNEKENAVEQAVKVFTTSQLPLTKYTDGQSQNGEDSVSISMNSSRPPSTKLNKTVHFGMNMNTMHKIVNSMDIEETKEDESNNIVSHHNLFPSQIKNNKKRSGSREKREKLSKLRNVIAYNSMQNKNRRGSLRKLRLSQQNLHAHNGLNQLKNKLMDAKMEKKDVAKMTNEQLNEMLIYINRIQWLILDEKQKRESCVICGIQTHLFALLLPCKHTNLCFNCCSNIKECPMCQKSISECILPRK